MKNMNKVIKHLEKRVERLKKLAEKDTYYLDQLEKEERDLDYYYKVYGWWEVTMRDKIYYLKQKLCGLIFVIIGVITPIILDGDATVSLLLIPLGLYLIFTKNKIMYF